MIYPSRPQNRGVSIKHRIFLDCVRFPCQQVIKGCYTPLSRQDVASTIRYYLFLETEGKIHLPYHLSPGDKEVQKARLAPEGNKSEHVSVASACCGTVSCGKLCRCHPACAWHLQGCLRCPQWPWNSEYSSNRFLLADRRFSMVIAYHLPSASRAQTQSAPCARQQAASAAGKHTSGSSHRSG